MQAFGAWLVGQGNRGGWLGELATAAAKDPRFPRAGDAQDARNWLSAQRASGDDWEALEDAEATWLATR